MNIKKYIRNIFFFSLPILLVLVTAEYFLIKIPNDYTFKRNYLDNHSNEIENIIFGPSHTFSGINPEIIEGHTFNVANTAQPLEFDYKIFNKYKDSFGNLKTIFLAISYPSLWYTLNNNENRLLFSFNYYKYYGFKSESKQISFYSPEVLNRPLKVNFERLRQYYIKAFPLRKSDKYGWRERTKQNEPDNSAEKDVKRQTLKNLNSNKNIELLNHNVKLIESIIQWSKAKNVKVILVTIPMHIEFRKRINQDQYKRMINITSELAGKHHNTFYYNYFNDERFIDRDFSNATHLSSTGAIKLSKIINKKLNSLD